MKLWILVLSIVVAVSAKKRTFHGHQVLTLQPQSQTHVDFIRSLPDDRNYADFWKPDSADQVTVGSIVDIHFPKAYISHIKKKLNAVQLPFHVKIANLQDEIEREWKDILEGKQFNEIKTRQSKANTYYDSYHTIDEIYDWIDDIKSAYPDYIESESIGTSTEQRPLPIMTVTANKNADKVFMIDCGFHAREWVSHAFCQCLVVDLCSNYGSDPEITNIMDNLIFKIMPVFNPDGYAYSWTDDRMWRKTRSGPESGGVAGGQNCYGTDPNRNFDAGWGGEGSSSNACSDTYRGKTVESAPETAAYSDYIRAYVGATKAYLTVHSYSQFMIVPYSYTSDPNYYYPNNFDAMYAVAADTTAAISAVHGKTYEYGHGATAFYPASGGSDDMSALVGVPLSWTIELRDTGLFGFQLPANQISGTCDENLEGVITIANYVLDNY